VANVRFLYLPEQDATCDDLNSAVDFAVVPADTSAFCAANKLGLPTWSCPMNALEEFGALFYGGEPTALHQGVLVVNYSLYPDSHRPAVTPLGALKHELGHMLGMRHEHPWAPRPPGLPPICYLENPRDETPGVDVDGRRLTDYDRESVMHYPECGGYMDRDLDISKLDGVGIRQIYGQPASWYVPVI
jgi:hypothetical protein